MAHLLKSLKLPSSLTRLSSMKIGRGAGTLRQLTGFSKDPLVTISSYPWAFEYTIRNNHLDIQKLNTKQIKESIAHQKLPMFHDFIFFLVSTILQSIFMFSFLITFNTMSKAKLYLF